jgi:Fe-S-cluster containining protein
MTISSLLRVAPAPISPIAPAATQDPEPVFRVINRTVYFNGDCAQCRPHCGAFCCTAYGMVSLTEEEARSGLYVYKEVTEGCECPMCTRMRESGVQYTLLKQADGSCSYLDGEHRCSIYENRPETCRKYNCRNFPFRLTLG